MQTDTRTLVRPAGYLVWTHNDLVVADGITDEVALVSAVVRAAIEFAI